MVSANEENLPDEQIVEIDPKTNEPLPNLSLINMSQGFQAFVSQIGPLVDGYEVLYNIFTLKDTRDTITFLCVATYAIIY